MGGCMAQKGSKTNSSRKSLGKWWGATLSDGGPLKNQPQKKHTLGIFRRYFLGHISGLHFSIYPTFAYSPRVWCAQPLPPDPPQSSFWAQGQHLKPIWLLGKHNLHRSPEGFWRKIAEGICKVR